MCVPFILIQNTVNQTYLYLRVYAVHLSASMITLHWLSGTEVPGASLAGLDRVQPNEPGVPAEVRAAFADKAHADLSQFLQQRTQELVPGGEAEDDSLSIMDITSGDGQAHLFVIAVRLLPLCFALA